MTRIASIGSINAFEIGIHILKFSKGVI